MNILVIGAGAYGLALANILSDKNKVLVYSKIEEEIKRIQETKEFQNVKLSEEIRYTYDKQDIQNIDICVIVIPTQFIKQTIKEIKNKIKKSKIIIASKGTFDNRLISKIVKEELPQNEVSVLSGPSFAIDSIKKQTIMLTLAGKNTKKLKHIFNEKYVKIQETKDIIGTQIYGTIKNTFAIATGILEGLEASESTKAALMTKLINETRKIIKIYNGKEETLLLSCGIGDIILTCTSKKSRNYTLGYMIGKKEDFKNYIKNETVEGLGGLDFFRNDFKIEIIEILYNIVYNNAEPKEILTYILK